jgi:aryl-alcohol dehydrogenase-like predicted oxidoreductase
MVSQGMQLIVPFDYQTLLSSHSSNEERPKLLDRAWEIGCTNWNAADVYGDNEVFIGSG